MYSHSYSHEDSYGDGSSAARSEADAQGDNGLPDSQVLILLIASRISKRLNCSLQGFESGKRSAETPDGDTGRVKRTKSEEET